LRWPDAGQGAPVAKGNRRIGRIALAAAVLVAAGCSTGTTDPATASQTTPLATASFNISPDPAVRLSPTRFTSKTTCRRGPCIYRWFHGDAASTEEIEAGAVQPNAEASFTYVGPRGERTITLKVTDKWGRQATATRTFQLVDAPPPPDNDADNDGVLDAEDACRNQPGPASNNGCPTPSPGFPDASTTGVPRGTVLTPSGGMTINTPGAVIDARDISGPVVVNAPDVTIRRSRIRSSSFWVVTSNSTGLVLEDCEIDGQNANNTAIGSSSITVRRCNIHGAENGFNVSGNMDVQDSYIHDLTTANGAHTDGAQFNQGASDIVFRHNTIRPNPDAVWRSTSAIIMWNEGDPQNTRVRIENNRLIGTGASYALYAPRQPASNIYINNNRFMTGVGGITNSVRVGVTVTEFNGNVYDDTGLPVSPGS